VTFEDWEQALAAERFGLRLSSGVSESALTGAGEALGSPLPGSLADFYRFTDGIFDEPGQWYVAWPLARLVGENQARPLPGLVGFGDDGTGDWFAVRGRDGIVVYVSRVTGDQHHLADSLATFWSGWLAGEITT